MTFTEFVHILKPIVGGSYSTSVFTKTLFETIITEEGLLTIEDISDNTYKAYFNGQTKINKIAQRIFPYLEPEQFIEYLGNFPDATVQSLCDSFNPYIEGISLFNVSEKIAYYFESILKEAASEKRKSTSKSAKKEKNETEVVDDNESSDADFDEQQNTTIIQNQVNVIQNGDNNMNFTNTGTITFNFGGDD